MLGASALTWAAVCVGLFASVQAAPGSTTSSSASSTTTTPSHSNCPYPIGIKNRGFESGKIAPWTLAGNTSPAVTQKIVSPGYNNSKYALQVHAPASNITEYTLVQTTTGKECFGYYFYISYSWNWLHYTGPEGDGSDGSSYCSFSVGTGYSSPVGAYVAQYGSRTPGWNHRTYLARDFYSHCMDLYAEFTVDVTCLGQNGTVLPPFTLLVDDLNIKNAPGDPNGPPPPTSSC